MATFTSAPSDTSFCQASLKDNEIGQYVISWNVTRANNAFITQKPFSNVHYAGSTSSRRSSNADQDNDFEGNGAGVRLPSNDSIQTTFSVASNLHEGDRTKVFTISGPDSDCDEAVNFLGMLQALKDVSNNERRFVQTAVRSMPLDHDTESDSDSEGGVLLASPISEHSEDGGVRLFDEKQNNEVEDLAPSHPPLTMDAPAAGSQSEELIAAMKMRVQDFLVQLASSHNVDKLKLPKILVVESFLLFSNPSSISQGDRNPDTYLWGSAFYTALHKLKNLSARLEEKGGADDQLEQKRDAIENNIRTVNGVCKRGMMEHFHCNLWLSTSFAAAKGRRFSRPAYLDKMGGEGEGGRQRVPGQMWKTEGYFDQIAWKNHLRSHAWLIGEGGEEEVAGELRGYKNGVHIRAQDLDVEDTVGWAVDAVLEEMGKLVKGVGGVKADDEWKVSCGGCESGGSKGGAW